MKEGTAQEDRHRGRGYLLRMPDEVRAELQHLADDHNRSLNGEIVYALRIYAQRSIDGEDR